MSTPFHCLPRALRRLEQELTSSPSTSSDLCSDLRPAMLEFSSDRPPALRTTPLSPAAPRSPLVPLSPAFLARGIRHSTRRGPSQSTAVLILASIGLVALMLRLLPGLPLEGSLLASSTFDWGFPANSSRAAAQLASEPSEQAHPIFGLMQAAEERCASSLETLIVTLADPSPLPLSDSWLKRRDRQSRTLEQAVAEYRRVHFVPTRVLQD